MKIEIIEKIAAGLRKAGGDKPLFIITTDYKYSGDEICGIKVVYNPLLGFSEQDSRDCPFIPLYKDMEEDYDRRAFNFRKGYEEY